MTTDSIVDEVRAVRDEIAREHQYEISAIFAALRERATKDRGTRVKLPARAARKSSHVAVPSADAVDASRRG